MSEASKQKSGEVTRRVQAEMEEILARGDIQEIAEFFDRTDTSDLDLKETDVVIERPELEQISLRLPKKDLEKLRRQAAKSGIGYTTLIRVILREHLNDSPGR